MTPEELDEARTKEALRLWAEEPNDNPLDKWGPRSFQSAYTIGFLAARLAREGWTPTPPVDPDLLEVREIVALEWQQFGSRTVANETRSGDHDDKWFVNCALAAYKAGREAEAERAKALVEPAEAIVNRAVKGTGANDVRWVHIVKAARRLEKGLNAYKSGKEAGK